MPVKGNGKTLGLTNGTTTGSMTCIYGTSTVWYTDNYNSNVGSATSGTKISDNKGIGITTDASKSGIVGTITRTQINCQYVIKY